MQLTITLDPAGRGVQVRGPIHDKMICYAMLEMAKDAIRAHDPSEPKIEVPRGVLLNEVKP